MDDFQALLDGFTQTNEFNALQTDRERADSLIRLRDKFKEANKDSIDDASASKIDGLTQIQADYIKKHRFVPSAEDLVQLNVELPDFNSLDAQTALKESAKARENMLSGVDGTFDPVYAKDYKFAIDSLFNEEDRRIRGRSTGKAADLGYRAMQGFAVRALQSVGMTDQSEEIAARYFPENPAYDTDFSSDLAQGAGDFVVTMGAVLGATALTGSPWAGGAVGLHINGMGKYAEGYKQALNETGSELSAHKAGVAALPGAVVESMGELLIAGRFQKAVNPAIRKAYLEAPDFAAKKKIVSDLLTDKSVAKRLRNEMAIQAAQEGTFESLGSFVSGVGSSAATGLDLTPTGKQLFREGSVAAILGGGMGGVTVGVEAALDSQMRNNLANAKKAIESGDEKALDEAVSAMAEEKKAGEKTKENKDGQPNVKLTPDLNPATGSVNDDGTVTYKSHKGIQLNEQDAKIHDLMVQNLIAQQTLDEVDVLAPGKGKGQRNNPEANIKRSGANAEMSAIDQELDTLLPSRRAWQDQVDAVGKETGVNAVDLGLFKRSVDAVVLTALQHGINPNEVYGNMPFQAGEQTSVPSKNVSDKRFKELDYKFGRYNEAIANLDPADELGRFEKAREVFGDLDKDGRMMSVELGKLEKEYQDEKEVRDLISSYSKDSLDQAGSVDVRQHFNPDAFKNFDKSNLGWKEVLVDMPIDDFLGMAKRIKDDGKKISEVDGLGVVTSQENADALKQLVENGTQFDDLPYLYLDDSQGDAKVTGHEGRHRAKALKALGYDTIPVVVKTNKIRWSEQGDQGRDFYRLSDEEWPKTITNEDGDTTIDFPIDRNGAYKQLNIKQEDTIKENSDNLTLSQLDDDYLRLAQDPEKNKDKLQRMVDEAARAAGYYILVWQGVKGGGIQGGSYNPKFIGRYNDSPLSKIGYMFSTEFEEAAKYGKPQKFYLRANQISEQRSLAGGTWSAKEAVRSGFDTLVWRGTTDASDVQSDIYLIAPGNEQNIKSADLVTYDESGQVIPLSQRFNPESNSILYQEDNSTLSRLDEDYMAAIETGDIDRVQQMVEDTARAYGYDIEVFHGSRETELEVLDPKSVPPQKRTDSGRYGWDATYLSTEEEAGKYGKKKYRFFLKLENPFIIPDGSDFYTELNKLIPGASREIVQGDNFAGAYIKQLGFDGVYEENAEYQGSSRPIYAVYDSNQVKSADPITYDKDGNIIPLSQRFNPESDSILHQKPKKAQGKISFNQKLNTDIKSFDSSLKAVITIMKNGGNITTFHHETFHYFHRSGLLASLLTAEQLQAFEKAANVKDGQWSKDSYELAARTYEAWLRNPKVPGEQRIRVPSILDAAFQRISASIRKIYQNLRLSGLPFEEVKGIARPQIDPAFRAVFEAMYSYELQPNVKSGQQAGQQGQLNQNASQLASVTPQLTGQGVPVSGQQANQNVTESQLYEYDDQDRLNIKSIEKVKHRGSTDDSKIIKLFKDIIELNAGLRKDTNTAGMFYAALDNYIRAKKLVKPEEYQILSVNPRAYTDENYEEFIRKAGDPAYSKQLIIKLEEIKSIAYQKWMDNYREQNEKWLKDAPSDLSRKELVKWVKDKKLEGAQSGDAEKSERRESIEQNTLLLQAALNTSDRDSMMAELGVPDHYKANVNEFLEMLGKIDIASQELDDLNALEIQITLDNILNNGVLIGMKNFAKQKARSWLGVITDKAKFRDPYAKWGLIGILNSVTNDAMGQLVTRLSLTSTNLERLAGNQEGRNVINGMTATYMEQVGLMQEKVNEWTGFMQKTREKWWPNKSIERHSMHVAGMISKIMQAPQDATQEQRDEFVRESSQQMLKGIQNTIRRGGNQQKGAEIQLGLFKKIMDGLDEETFTQQQFIDNASKNFPKEYGYVTDMVEWLDANIKNDAKFVSESLYENPFNEFMHYLPTRQIPLSPEKFSPDNLDLGESAIANNYGDAGTFVKNVLTTDRADALKERKGYVKDDFAFATNLENTLDRGVKAILNDIYLGFERQKLSYLLNPNSTGRKTVEMKLGGGLRASHLLQVIRDMVSVDLNEHPEVSGVEALANRVKRNIAPAMLSSLHQFITQPVSQMVAHGSKRLNVMLSSYGDAMKLLTIMPEDSKVYQSWKKMDERHLSTRALPQDPLLTKGKAIHGGNFEGLNKSIFDRIGIESSKVDQMKNWAADIDEKVKQHVLLGGLRMGDLFSAKMIFAAELIHAAKEQQKVRLQANGKETSANVKLEDLDLTKLTPESVVDAINAMDETINASRNSRRGYYLAHPNVIVNLLTVFSGHRLSMANNFGLKLRNLVDLGFAGKDDPMFKDSVATAVSTIAQSVAFTGAKALIVGALARGIYMMLTPDEDDERHWLYGDLEKKEVEALRKMTEDSLALSFSPEATMKGVFRDAVGTAHWAFAFGGLDNYIMLNLDRFAKPLFDKGKQELVDELEAKIQDNFDKLTFEQVEDLKRQIEVIKGNKFAPFGFKDFGEADLGGGFGLAAQPAMDLIKAGGDIILEDKDFSMEEVLLLGRLFGYGQPEVTRGLKMAARQRDKLQDLRTEAAEDESETIDFGF